DEDVVVVSVGMMTSVGLSAAETAASVRAGTMRFTATPLMDMAFQPFTLAVVPDDGLPDLDDALKDEVGLSGRELRMLRLGTLPLLECLKPLAGDNALGLVLSLPEAETARPLDRPRFLRLFCKQTKEAFDPARSECDLKGRAGGVAAVGRAAKRVREGIASFV